MITTRLSLLALATALTASAVGQATFQRTLPDYDQRRSALPGGGNEYCVPTSYSDILRYMAMNGITGAAGATNSSYSSITNLIKILGQKMDTNTTSGTNGSNGFDAIVDWFDDRVSIPCMHIAYGPDGNWGIGTIHNWLAFGAMVRIGYGRYTKDSSNHLTRAGGHSIAVAGYDYTKTAKQFFVADPAADDGNPNAQGSFTLDEKHLWNIPMTYNGDPISHARYTDWTGSGNQLAIVDDMHVIAPLWFGWLPMPQPSEFAGNFVCDASEAQGEVTFHAAVPRAFAGVDTERSIDVPVPGPVKDWCIDPGDVAIYVLDESGDIYHVDLMSKTHEKVTNVKNARKLTVAGTRFELFVLRDAGAQDEVVKYDAVLKRKSRLQVEKGITMIEADPSTLGIAALNEGKKHLLRIDPELRQARPQQIDLPEGAGQAFVVLNRTGAATVARRGASALVRAAPFGASSRIPMGRSINLDALQPFGKEQYLVQAGGKLRSIDASGRSVASPFDNVSVDGPFRVAQNWKAFRKGDVSGPAWRDVPPKPGEP